MLEAHYTDDRGIPKLETPARLVLATNAGNEIDPVMGLLTDAGLTRDGLDSRNRLPRLVDAFDPGDLSSIPEWLAGNPDAHLLLLFNAHVPLIARNMAEGLPPGQALDRWLADAQAILKIVRRHRRRLTLLPLEGVLADPAGFMDILGQRLGIGLAPVARHDGGAAAPGALFRMMAGSAVWQSTEARDVAAELEANALPMPPAPGIALPMVDEVYREFSQTIEQAREREEAYKVELRNMHQTEEIDKNQQLQERNDETMAQNEARFRDLQEENELLLQQLQHVQEELESYYLSGTDVRRELEDARATIDALYKSKSWKITKPLRYVLDLLTRQHKS